MKNDFEMIDSVNEKWKLVTAYYSCYNYLYAILKKMSIKFEIHDCTLSLMELVGFDYDSINFLKELKINRFNVQYYLKPAKLVINKNIVLDFLDKSKFIFKELNDDKINSIEQRLKN